MNKFNEALEDKVRAYMAQRRPALPDPNGRIIFVPGSYTPSIVSVAQVVEAREAGVHKAGIATTEVEGMRGPLWLIHRPIVV